MIVTGLIFVSFVLVYSALNTLSAAVNDLRKRPENNLEAVDALYTALTALNANVASLKQNTVNNHNELEMGQKQMDAMIDALVVSVENIHERIDLLSKGKDDDAAITYVTETINNLAAGDDERD